MNKNINSVLAISVVFFVAVAFVVFLNFNEEKNNYNNVFIGNNGDSLISNRVKNIEEAQEISKGELEIYSPKIGESVNSPLKIIGRVKGGWFFEGSFPVKLMDKKGNIFAESYASSINGDWMNGGWIEISANVSFLNQSITEGFIVFEKDNPSGIDAYDYSVSMPVKFNFSNNDVSEEKSVHIYGKCGHDPKDDPILGDCGEDCNMDNFKTYKNDKYGYSFKYHQSFSITKSCKHSNCIMEEQGGDVVVLAGDLSQKGWPMIEISHLQTNIYNPSSNFSSLAEWLIEKFPWTEKCLPNSKNVYFKGKDGKIFGGFNIYFPSSPQAYSRREIYYEYEGKIFQMVMLDVNEPQARQFYDNFLATFKIVSEN